MITGNTKLEQKCESAHKHILKLTSSQDALLLANIILNNDLTLTMKIIDVTQYNTAQLRANKKELKTLFQKSFEDKQIGFDPEFT